MTTCTVCELHAESVFKIEGMDCHEEVTILEQRLKRLAGLESLDADVLGQRLSVKYDAAKLSTSLIAEAMAQTGKRAWLEHEEPRPAAGSHVWRDALILMSAVLVGAGFVVELTAGDRRWAALVFALAIVTGGVHTAKRAWMSVRGRTLDITCSCWSLSPARWRSGNGRRSLGRFPLRARTASRVRAMERAGAIRALMDSRLRPHSSLEVVWRAYCPSTTSRRRCRHRQARRENPSRRPGDHRNEPRQSGAGDGPGSLPVEAPGDDVFEEQ